MLSGHTSKCTECHISLSNTQYQCNCFYWHIKTLQYYNNGYWYFYLYLWIWLYFYLYLNICVFGWIAIRICVNWWVNCSRIEQVICTCNTTDPSQFVLHNQPQVSRIWDKKEKKTKSILYNGLFDNSKPMHCNADHSQFS